MVAVRERCFDGSLYRLDADSTSGVPGSSGEYLRTITNLLQDLVDHMVWQGSIVPMEVKIPAGTQRRHIRVTPPARTIRIETDTEIQLWLNDDSGTAITMGDGRRIITLSDLPPAAAIHDVIVTTMSDNATIFILGVA